MQYVWLGFILAAIIIESITQDLVAIWFLPGALVAMILAFTDVSIGIQVLIFVVLGIGIVFATRSFCKKILKNKEEKTNAPALIGKVCIVTEEIRNIEETGEVKVGGLCWSARSEDPDRVIAIGEQVTILEIQGVKLIVK